ncbi:Ribosome biogenesis protein NOP53 [Pseudozyma hubeiensis]|nr:Ribosome biogenesis protein NOP53 [Pseudozyma hubeiensis]
MAPFSTSQIPSRTMAPTRTRGSAIGAPSQPAQSSRKGKKAWRKNIDLSTTESFLEQQSDPLRATSSDVLFVEDRSGQETLAAKQARTKRPLKSLEILQNSYGHSAVTQPARAKHDKKMESRLRKMVGRQQVGVKGDKSAIAQKSDDVVKKNLSNVYDVWSTPDDKGKSKATEKEDWIPAEVSKPTVSLPKTLRRDDYENIASTLPAIDLPHPGSSYNPDLESHEALIQEAYEIELKLEQNEQMAQSEREKWQAKLATIVAREAEMRSQKDDQLKRYRGMDVDLPSDNDDDDDASNSGAESLASDTETAAPGSKRKTRAQRLRAKRVRHQQSLAQLRRAARIESAAILQLPALRRREARLATARAQAAEQRRLDKLTRLSSSGLSGHKIGKHTVPDRHIDVQTADQLSESLRTLQPEGNLFRDRYHRLQVRGKVEPRAKQFQ